MELFRPSLNYPMHPYDEILARTAERFPENVALVAKDVNLTYRLHLGRIVKKGH